MEELRSAVEETIAGRGRLAMLVGESGIGKTRAAQELAPHAETLGVQVLWGKGDGEFNSSKLFKGGGQPLTIVNIDVNSDGYGSAVMYEPGKILKAGGFKTNAGNFSTRVTEIIDMNTVSGRCIIFRNNRCAGQDALKAEATWPVYSGHSQNGELAAVARRIFEQQ